MKLLFISDCRSIHVKRWIKFLQEKGYSVDILSVNPGKIDGTKVYYRNPGDSKGHKWFRFIQQALFLLLEWRLLKYGNYDIVHVHFLRADATALVATSHKRSIISLWGSDARLPAEGGDRRRQRYRRLALENASLVTAVHPSLEKRARKTAPNLRRVEIIPFGVDLNRFSGIIHQTDPENKLRFCFAKPLAPLYGPDIAIKAFHKFVSNYPSSKLTLIGGGDPKYVEELQNLVQIYGLVKLVTFAGKVSDDVFDEILSCTDVLIQPSRWDAFGVVILEALAAGIPVIASRVGGTKDMVLDGITGYTVNDQDIDALVKAMHDMAEDKARRLKMASNAKELSSNIYSFEMHAERMLELYQELISG